MVTFIVVHYKKGGNEVLLNIEQIVHISDSGSLDGSAPCVIISTTGSDYPIMINETMADIRRMLDTIGSRIVS